jgi:cysteine synthase
MVIAIDDEAPVSLIRLFNEPAGKKYLAGRGVPAELINKLDWLGISGVSNVLSAIKFAKYYELGENDIVLTILTDSMALYQSRLAELTAARGAFTDLDAAGIYHRYLLGAGLDSMQELGYYDRKRVHNLKYYTWVEQQGKTYAEIQAQWYDDTYWTGFQSQVEATDALIEEFNAKTGLLKSL